MHRSIIRLLTIAALAVVPLAPAAASAVSGTFVVDDEIHAHDLTLAAPAAVRARTTSWAQGGFAPVLSLFDGVGTLLAVDVGSTHACTDPGAGAPDAAAGFCWDAWLDLQLGTGLFTLVVSQDGNAPLGPTLGDGFARTGEPDYTGVAYLGQPGLRFINVDGGSRSGSWSLEITVQPLAVPAPGSALLAALALAGLGITRRPRRRS